MSKASLIIVIIILALIAGLLVFYFLIQEEKPPPISEGEEEKTWEESHPDTLTGILDLSGADPTLTTKEGKVYILYQPGLADFSSKVGEKGFKAGDKIWVQGNIIIRDGVNYFAVVMISTIQ